MRVLDIYISAYLLGYIFFFTSIEFGITKFDEVFFLWNNLAYGSIGGFASLYAVGSRVVKMKVKYPLIFSCIMYAWELIVFFTKWDINNPWAVMVCFLALVGVISYFMFRQFERIKQYL